MHPDDEPMVASGPSSGSKDGVPRRREPQLDEETEVKPEPKVDVKMEGKKEPSPKGTCDTCSKSKIAPARAKVSGIRSEVFGELTFIGHGDVSINPQSKLHFLLLYDGATSLTTAYVIQNRSDTVTISHLQEYFDTYQLNPRYIVADQAFMGTEMEDFYGRHNNIPVVPHKAVAEVPKIGNL